MAYVKDRLIARRGYSGFGDTTTPATPAPAPSWWESLLGGTVTGIGQNQAAQQSSAAAVNQAIAAQAGSSSMSNVMLIGALGVGAYLLFKRKK